MQRIAIIISEKNLIHLEALKQECGLLSRSQALEIIIDQLFKEKGASRIKRKE